MTVKSGRRKGKTIIFVYLALPVLLYVTLFLYPTIYAVRMCFYRWKGLNFANAKFIGLDNFLEAFGDRWVRLAVRNNFLIMFVGGVLIFSLSLLFAVALTNGRLRGKDFFRTVIFFPYMISGVGVGLFWTFVLNPRFGALNGVLQAIGLESLTRAWLGEPKLALASIIYVVVWWGIGFYMLFLMAGIKSIPISLFDAARVDGASERQLFFHITLPLLRQFLAIAIVLWMIEALKTFDVVLLLTGGGPANQTQVLTTYMAKMAFNLPAGSAGAVFRFGYGTALAVILFSFVLLASLLYFRLARTEAMEF